MAAETLISILTPTRNRPKMLRRALASVRAQSLAAWEHLVIDDGDGEALALVREIGDPRIRGLDNRGRGVTAARNLGVSEARAPLLAYLDDDDWWEDTARLATAAQMLRQEEALLYQTGWIVYEDDGSREPYPHRPAAEDLRRNNQLLLPSVLYPARCHQLLGPFDETMGNYSDWDWYLRVLDAGFPLREIPGPGVVYAVHDRNTSAQLTEPRRRAFFERFRDRHGLEIEMLNHLLMHRKLLAGEGAEP